MRIKVLSPTDFTDDTDLTTDRTDRTDAMRRAGDRQKKHEKHPMDMEAFFES